MLGSLQSDRDLKWARKSTRIGHYVDEFSQNLGR